MKYLSKKNISRLNSMLLAVAGASVMWGCSTVESGTGRCTSYKDPKYVASSRDTDGKEWELRVTPDVADLKCDEEGDSGELELTAFVFDGQGFAKPALAVTSAVVGSTGAGFVPVEDKSDVATDACGVAKFRVKWTCPAAKKSAGGYFYVTSGPLSSKAIKLTIEHVVQPDTTITTTR